LVIDSESVSEKSGWGKATGVLIEDPEGSTGWARCIQQWSVLAWGMDKKEINSPKLTLNFLIWIGGVFMLLLFAFLAHFVWRLF
jgi:hypothetical protein